MWEFKKNQRPKQENTHDEIHTNLHPLNEAKTKQKVRQIS